jgi:hypothetical protein
MSPAGTLEFIIEVNSYLNIPPYPRKGREGGMHRFCFRASALIVEHHASFCGGIAAKVALQSICRQSAH